MSNPATAAVAPAANALSPEALRQRGTRSRLKSAALGDLMRLILRNPAYNQLPIEWIRQMVVPAVATGQVSIARVQSPKNGALVPVAAVTWASVSPEVDARLRASLSGGGLQIAPAEFRSGKIVWLIDTLGHPQAIGRLMGQLRERAWAGKVVRFRASNPDGSLTVQELA